MKKSIFYFCLIATIGLQAQIKIDTTKHITRPGKPLIPIDKGEKQGGQSSSSQDVWLLNGNRNTDPTTHFIGTLDTYELNFKVGNARVGHLGTFPVENVFWGRDAGISNSSGTQNTAVGTAALSANLEGRSNTAMGYMSLYRNTTGIRNTAIGTRSLEANTLGSHNTAIGYGALWQNTSGIDNVAIGMNPLENNTTGSTNVAIGRYAAQKNTTGSNNVAIGHSSLGTNTRGQHNTAVGDYSLSNNFSGNYLTAIGYGADVTTANLTNSTAIGYNAKVVASNKIRIGNEKVTQIEGQVAWSNPSDARFKYHIQNNVPGLEFITKLNPVTYYFDTEKLETFTRTGIVGKTWSDKEGMPVKTGFLAQEVEKIVQEIGYEFDGINAPQNERDNYTLSYSQFVMPLVKAVQEQQKIIEAQQQKISLLEAEVAKIDSLNENHHNLLLLLQAQNQKIEAITKEMRIVN